MAEQKHKHTHALLPFNGYVDQGECKRCDQLRSIKRANGETPHNHQIRSRRLLPLGQCERCDELHKGAPAREGFQSRAQRDAAADAERAAAIKAHFAPGHDERCHYMTKGAGVCVYGDW